MVWNRVHAARWKCRTPKLSGYIFAIKAHIDNRKNLLNNNVSPTCPHNMVNFGLLAAEICWRVWGTPAIFNGFRVLAALLHGTLVVGVRQNFAALNRRRHLHSPGRSSRWALAHISSYTIFLVDMCLTKLCDGDQMAIFWVLHFQRAARSTFQTCILNSH